MTDGFVTSDNQVLDLLRKTESLTVPELATATEVTATAVRQRLTRLMAQGYIERYAESEGRGRPSHRYRLTTKGRRKTGNNFAELATALWEEVRAIPDPEVRKGLLNRLASRMAESFAGSLDGETFSERLESLANNFQQRQIAMEVSHEGELPVLKAHSCPFPELADQDQAICAVEKMMLSELLGENLKLSECRLNGEDCCTFTAQPTRDR